MKHQTYQIRTISKESAQAKALMQWAQRSGYSSESLCKAGEIVRVQLNGVQHAAFAFKMTNGSSKLMLPDSKGRKVLITTGPSSLVIYPRIKSEGPIYFFEGETDYAAALANDPNCIAIPGARAFSALRNADKDLRSLAISSREARVMFDNDETGRSGAKEVSRILQDEFGCKNINIFQFRDFQEAKDIREILEIRKLPWSSIIQEFEAPVTVSTSRDFRFEPVVKFWRKEPPPLLKEFIPDPIIAVIEAISDATEASLDLIFFQMLSVASVPLSRHFRVQASQEWYEPLNLYMMCFLPSGDRKSATLSICKRPLEIREQALHAAWVERQSTIRAEIEVHNAKLEERKRRLQKTEKPEDQKILAEEILELTKSAPKNEPPPQILCGDVTPEKLADLMAENDERMALIDDEAGIFETIGGRYSNGISNLDLFLKAFNASSVRINRKTSGSVLLNEPLLTIGLSPQPSIAESFRNHPEFRSRGFLARFLISFPTSVVGSRSCVLKSIPAAILCEYEALMLSLLTMPESRNDEGRLILKSIQLDEAATRVFGDFRRVVEALQVPGEKLEPISDFGSRFPGQVLRLAGIDHCLRYRHASHQYQIDAITINKYARFCLEYLIPHTLEAVYRIDEPKEQRAAKRLIQWIQRNGEPQFSRRDCQRALGWLFKKVDDLVEILNFLERNNIVLPKDPTRRMGRPSSHYLVNPEILSSTETNDKTDRTEV